MYKKLFTATVMLATLVFFVSCQKDMKGSKDNKKSEKTQKNKKPTFSSLETSATQENQNVTTNENCCPNENEEVAVTKEDELTQEVKPEENLPIDEFKASINSQNDTLDITEAEKDSVELQK